jgi:hypothetical protein
MSMQDYNMEQAKKHWGNQSLKYHEGVNMEQAKERSLEPQIISQMEAMVMNLACLEERVQILTKRLHPVLIDVPTLSRCQELADSMSPVAAGCFEANQRLRALADDIQGLMERLEV